MQRPQNQATNALFLIRSDRTKSALDKIGHALSVDTPGAVALATNLMRRLERLLPEDRAFYVRMALCDMHDEFRDEARRCRERADRMDAQRAAMGSVHELREVDLS